MTQKRKRGWNLKRGNPDGDRGRRLGGLSHDREHLVEAGRKGWKSLVAKVGIEDAHGKLREYRLANPTDLEQIVMKALGRLNVYYDREVALDDGERFCVVDFIVRSVGVRLTAIEVDGEAFHGGELTHERNAEHEATKERLCALHGYRLVRLPERVVRNGSLDETLRKELGL